MTEDDHMQDNVFEYYLSNSDNKFAKTHRTINSGKIADYQTQEVITNFKYKENITF